MPTITESVYVFDGAEANLLSNGRIQLHVEDADGACEPEYTLEQIEALHRTLGHLLYLANQEA